MATAYSVKAFAFLRAIFAFFAVKALCSNLDFSSSSRRCSAAVPAGPDDDGGAIIRLWTELGRHLRHAVVDLDCFDVQG